MSDDKVGYKKPPKGTRFKKGKSGNPRGRPKKQAQGGIGEALMRALAKPATVRIGGRPVRVTAREAIARARVHAACQGDIKAMKDVMLLMRAPGDYQTDSYTWGGDWGVPHAPPKAGTDEQ